MSGAVTSIRGHGLVAGIHHGQCCTGCDGISHMVMAVNLSSLQGEEHVARLHAPRVDDSRPWRVPAAEGP